MDADGEPVHAGDMAAQVGQALDNLETVLADAGFSLADVVRLNYFVTDVDAFLAAGETWGGRLGAAGCRPASTLLGVARLALPADDGRDRGVRRPVARRRGAPPDG